MRGVVITKTLATLQFPIQGGPERTQHLRSIISKTRDRMNKLCALLRIHYFSSKDDTKIVTFDEGVLILWPFF